MKRKVALVTGSAKGIGREIILELARNNIDVVINYNTSKSEALALKDEVLKLGVNVLAIKADVANVDEVNKMINTINETFDGVDILVNNAAIDIDEFFKKKQLDSFRKTFEVNVIAAFNISRLVSKHMLENKWGRIINISSTNGINTYYPICMEYDASKAALNSLTHNLALELAPYVTVNAVAPGFIGTRAELDYMDEEFIKSEEDKIFLKRMGKPEEVAKLVRFLASDDASYINNAIIRIDGGQYGG